MADPAMTSPAADWDAEAAARGTLEELSGTIDMIAWTHGYIHDAELLAIIARHLTLARSTAPSSEATMQQVSFSVVAYDESGYGDNASKEFGNGEEAVNYAQSLEPRYNAVVFKNIKTETIRAKIWPHSEVLPLPPAQPPVVALSSIPAVRRAVQAALDAGLCSEDAVVLGAWVERNGGREG